jgi:hypothetical protein
MTMLRSTPCGRGGCVAGNSPPAMRSVQSANRLSARLVSSRPMLLTMLVIAWPDWMRRSHASIELSKCPSSLGMVRVALSPSWWQV